MRSYLTQDELERESVWLEALEDGAATVADLISITGYSRAQVYKRLARARQQPPPANRGDLDRYDFPLMELVDAAPERPTQHEWCTHSGEASRDSGTYHLGGQVRNLDAGFKGKDDDSREDGKPHATKYEPDPTGLKGGKG